MGIILIVFYLISFSCLIDLSSASITILKRSWNSVTPCLISDFNGIASSYSSFRMILVVNLSYIAFIMFRYYSSATLFRTFTMNPCYIFKYTFSWFYWDDHVISVFMSIYMIYFIYLANYVETSQNLHDQSNMIMLDDDILDICLY